MSGILHLQYWRAWAPHQRLEKSVLPWHAHAMAISKAFGVNLETLPSSTITLNANGKHARIGFEHLFTWIYS